ncbi:hypothetical protein GGGNBK_19165 [Sporosarcina sp. ANT_H38]
MKKALFESGTDSNRAFWLHYSLGSIFIKDKIGLFF